MIERKFDIIELPDINKKEKGMKYKVGDIVLLNKMAACKKGLINRIRNEDEMIVQVISPEGCGWDNDSEVNSKYICPDYEERFYFVHIDWIAEKVGEWYPEEVERPMSLAEASKLINDPNKQGVITLGPDTPITLPEIDESDYLKLQRKEKVKFLYIRDKNEPRRVMTIAYKKYMNKVNIGFTICNPVDQFSRKEGRRLALEKLAGNPIRFPLYDHIQNIAKGIIDMLKNRTIPNQRLERLLKNYEIVCRGKRNV